MVTIILILCALVLLAVLAALRSVHRLGLSFRQAVLYTPMKLAWRIGDRRIRMARRADAPVIYAIAHQSALDPALMLALLPEDTLHILDQDSAKASWLEPYRALARTIPFRPEHVFLSRRLVRHLKGRGRLAVYFPQTVEPDAASFRLFRAVARIAAKAGADVVTIHVDGSADLGPAAKRKSGFPSPRRWLPRLVIGVTDPVTLDTLTSRAGRPPSTASLALFDRMAEASVAAAARPRSLFTVLARAARHRKSTAIAVEDHVSGALDGRRLMIMTRLMASRLARETTRDETVGLMLPNSVGMVAAFAAIQSTGCAAAMLNPTTGPAPVATAVGMAGVRVVVSSRTFVERAKLEGVVAEIEKAGGRMIWLEDLREGAGWFEMASASLFWRFPVSSVDPQQTSVILFTSGAEGSPKGVLLSHAALLANVAQIDARLRFSSADKVFNVLPAFHAFGLTAGTLLPLLRGVPLFLYPSPLHFRQIPDTVREVKPTILLGTDTFLAAYAREAKEEDFASVRLVIAGAEPVKAETRRLWHERFGLDVSEGYGLTEAGPVVAVNSLSHSRPGTVGRLLPSIRIRLELVDGIDEGGRLWISGPNLMRGTLSSSAPHGYVPPPEGWHDTGDIVSFDREGYLKVLGRAQRFANIAGEKVSLAAVDALADALWPDGRHVAVALPDTKRGERIVLVTTEERADRAALRVEARKRGVGPLLIPDKVLVVAELPILGTGKTDFRAAQRIAEDRIAGPAG